MRPVHEVRAMMRPPLKLEAAVQRVKDTVRGHTGG